MFLNFGSFLYGQNYNLTNTFSTKDGLPSNFVYEVVEDDKGFLWVATDNGVSRFDGKRFINYSTKNGLPSNDVVHVIKQNNGTIWANCYKQPPSYFDEKLNKFICLENDAHVRMMSNGLINDIYDINKNDLFFHNYLGNFKFSKGKILEKIDYKTNDKPNNFTKIYFNNELVALDNAEIFIKGVKNKVINISQNNTKLGSIVYEDSNPTYLQHIDNNGIYRFSANDVTQIKITGLHPFQYKIARFKIPEKIKWFKLSCEKLSIISTKGTIYIYDEKSLKYLSTIRNSFNVNTAYVDKLNNIWVATVNNGLFYYTNQPVKKEEFSNEVIPNFLCAKVADNGAIYAGNYQGEIYVKEGKTEKKFTYGKSKENNLWIRNIHFFPGKTIVVSDAGILIDFKRKMTFRNDHNRELNIKSSAKLNDKTLILGSVHGLLRLNVIAEKYEILNFPEERIINLKRIDDNTFYFSANDGLYRYDLISDKYELIISNSLFKNDRIQHFEPISKSQIWINTFKGNLFLIENQKIKKEFSNDERIPMNISKLLNIEQQLWMASKSGIFILDYRNLAQISISKLTTSDGLTSNVINSLDFKKDTVYAATDNGISKIPYPVNRLNHNVVPQIIAVKINEKTVPLASAYTLKADQKNISLELAGVDITGHFKNFQYAINKGKYVDFEGNFLNMQLGNGSNTVYIRVIDENNKIHEPQIKLIFDIEIPFYKATWFWILLSILITALVFYIYNRRKSALQNRHFNQQIELQKQRQKITADLHDDLGASLSSLQINSAVAQKLFEKNPDETRKILQKIESQAQIISENIGDIIWSLKPSADEFMTLSTRIKKITSEILGSSDIHYELLISNKIDAEITDFSARKNIILICKEALNNILKHSQAKEVCLQLQKTKDHYILDIEDDGIGFSEVQKKGNGVANMQRRTEELGGNFEIDHKNGTKLTFSIPIIRE